MVQQPFGKSRLEKTYKSHCFKFAIAHQCCLVTMVSWRRGTGVYNEACMISHDAYACMMFMLYKILNTRPYSTRDDTSQDDARYRDCFVACELRVRCSGRVQHTKPYCPICDIQCHGTDCSNGRASKALRACGKLIIIFLAIFRGHMHSCIFFLLNRGWLPGTLTTKSRFVSSSQHTGKPSPKSKRFNPRFLKAKIHLFWHYKWAMPVSQPPLLQETLLI